MLWLAIFVGAVLVLSGLAFWVYHTIVCGYERKVVAEYEEAQRQRQRQTAPRAPALEAAGRLPAGGLPAADEVLIEGVPEAVYRAECDDMLKALAHRRAQPLYDSPESD